MTVRFRYSDPRGIDEPSAYVALGSNVRYAQMALAQAAALGETGTSGIGIEDPGGIYDFAGLRGFEVMELSAPSNNQVIGQFIMWDRKVRRDADRALITGRDRFWDVDLLDYNWHLGKRLLTDADSKRPAETAGDRIRWLIRDAAHININDYGNVTYPTHQMDANDYRGQRPTDVLADCCIEGGYDFWLDFNEPNRRPELFFMATADAQLSTLYVSNDIADLASSSVVQPYMDGELTRSPARLTFGALLAYGSGWVYERNDTVGQQFAKLDQSAPMSNVKSAARARRIAQKFLLDNDEEDDTLVFGITVPAEQVNDVRHGQRITVKFSHLPGYEEWTEVFVKRRTVLQEEAGGRDNYKLILETTGPTAGEAPPVTFSGSAFGGFLFLSGTGAAPYEEWQHIGDDNPSGWYAEPNVGPITVWMGETIEEQTVTCNAAMTVRIEARVALNMVYHDDGVAMLKVMSSRYGLVGSDTVTGSVDGFNSMPQRPLVVDVHNYVAEAGESFACALYREGILMGGFWNNPGGANESYLRVGRGTHVWNNGTVTWVGS